MSPTGSGTACNVMVDDEASQLEGNVACGDVALAVAYERIRGLEEQVAFLQEQLGLEQHRDAELVDELKAVTMPQRAVLGGSCGSGGGWHGVRRLHEGAKCHASAFANSVVGECVAQCAEYPARGRRRN